VQEETLQAAKIVTTNGTAYLSRRAVEAEPLDTGLMEIGLWDAVLSVAALFQTGSSYLCALFEGAGRRFGGDIGAAVFFSSDIF